MSKRIIIAILIAIGELVAVNLVIVLFFETFVGGDISRIVSNITWFATIFMAIFSIIKNVRILNGSAEGKFPYWYTKFIIHHFWNKLLDKYR